MEPLLPPPAQFIAGWSEARLVNWDLRLALEMRDSLVGLSPLQFVGSYTNSR